MLDVVTDCRVESSIHQRHRVPGNLGPVQGDAEPFLLQFLDPFVVRSTKVFVRFILNSLYKLVDLSAQLSRIGLLGPGVDQWFFRFLLEESIDPDDEIVDCSLRKDRVADVRQQRFLDDLRALGTGKLTTMSAANSTQTSHLLVFLRRSNEFDLGIIAFVIRTVVTEERAAEER